MLGSVLAVTIARHKHGTPHELLLAAISRACVQNAIGIVAAANDDHSDTAFYEQLHNDVMKLIADRFKTPKGVNRN